MNRPGDAEVLVAARRALLDALEALDDQRSALVLIERLARFVPPPRVHRHRYHGVLAPNARLRPHVVAFGRPELRAEAHEPDDDAASPGLPPEPGPPPASPARIRWAVLLARIYQVLPLMCPACGGEMRILAFLTDPHGPPQIDFLTDPSPALDPAQPEPVPEFEFDQSLPDHFDFEV